ncbi:MAG: glycosyltransferase [Bacteroidia bacterium]|nr:glycosyltransferase [Bacteroidia bacterium]
MRILQVTNRIPYPLNDGGNIATWNVTKELHTQGHEVILASLNTQKHYFDPAKLPPVCEVHTVDIDTKLTPLGLAGGLLSSRPYNVMRFDAAAFHLLLADLLEKNPVDVIQLEGIYLALYLSTIRKFSKAPVILRSHNIEHQIWERLAKGEKNRLKRFYLKDLAGKIERFERENFAAFDGIIAITQQDADWYQKQGYSGKLQVIPAGVDTNVWFPGDRGFHARSVAFLGSLEWGPNVEGLKWFLDQVWAPVAEKFPQARFFAAGKNPPESLSRLKAPGFVFEGMVDDAPQFVRTHGIFVVPLLSGGGMRLKIVEAMAAGRCVISTRVGAEGIEAEEGTHILLADSPEEFQQALEEVLANPDRAERIGQAAQQLAVEKYSWKELVKAFEAFYFALQ